MMLLRWADSDDGPELALVFYAAIREGPSPYTQAQRVAWAPELPKGRAWAEKLARSHIIVAQKDKALAGFMSIETGGYIDLAFIRPDHQGKGLFRRLYGEIENWARSQNEPLLWTYASLAAQPAFRATGFLVIHHETVARHDQQLTRAKMEKALT